MDRLNFTIKKLLYVSICAIGMAGCGGGSSSVSSNGNNNGGGTTTPTCGTPTTASLPVITVGSSINTPTTWSAGNVYYVTSNLTVTAPLQIEPGVVVKFATGVSGGAGLIVNTGGTITATGNSTSSIVFTSYKDDSIGGDSNNDSADTQPARGDWGKIALAASGSTFNCVQFKYGGNYNSTLDIGGGFNSNYTATVTNSTFANNYGYEGSSNTLVDSIYARGTLDAGLAGAGTVITGNTFYDNLIPLSISGKFSVDDSNIFHKPDNASITNTYNGIFHVGNSAKPVTGNITYAETEIPYVLSGYIDVPEGSQLTLGDNVVIKFFRTSDQLCANCLTNSSGTAGKIIANASAGSKIVFTSWKDDAHGGDTNGDGTNTTPAKRDWSFVETKGNGSIFNRAEFYYGGFQGYKRCSLCLNTFSATVTNSIFAHNDGSSLSWPSPIDLGVYAADLGVLSAQFANSQTVITGNTFFDNLVPLGINGSINMDNSNVFHNPSNSLQTNTYNGIFFYSNSSADIFSINWSATEVPFVMRGDFFVRDGHTMTLGDNVVLKFADTASKMTIETNATINNQTGTGVHFTSIHDDSYKGDTDASTTPAAGGDWLGVRDGNWYYTNPGNIHYAQCYSGNIC